MIKTILLYRHSDFEKLNFQPDGRSHYVYRITNLITNKHYYGSRVTKLKPEDDLGIKYFSTSSNKEFITEQKEQPQKFKYKVIKVFNNPGDAIIYESYLHQYFQVSSHSSFINKSNQLPNGWTNTGNKEIVEKRLITINKINIKTGNTLATDIAIKGSKTMTKKDLISGKSIRDLAIIKMNNTNQIIDIKTGNTKAKDTALKGAKTLKTSIDIKTGKSLMCVKNLKSANTMRNINPKTGLTFIKESTIKHNNTINKINIKTGNTLATDIAIKGSKTMTKKDPISGKSIYDLNSEKTKGENHYAFKGYYCLNNNKFKSVTDMKKFYNNTLNPLWCKNPNSYPIKRNHSSSIYLQSLGSWDEIKYKTFYELGFSFIEKSS